MEKKELTWQRRSQDLFLDNIAYKFMQACVGLVGKTLFALSTYQAMEVPEKCLLLI